MPLFELALRLVEITTAFFMSCPEISCRRRPGLSGPAENPSECKIDATAVLFSNICQYMFYGCTSLKKAPALPSMNLSGNCYSNMFMGCTSLTDVPESLPATKLYERCYASMFYGCTSLQKAPKLPAETLVNSCYGSMFQNCSSLTEVWLYAKTNLSGGSGGLSMYTFDGCPSTGVTAHVPSVSVKVIKNCSYQPDWTYVDIETGEPL